MKKLFLAIGILSFTCVFAQNNCTTATSLGTLGTPANCGNGIKKGATTTQAGTNVGVTGSNPYTSLDGCNMASPANDVWYTFVDPPQGYGANITVSGGTLANPNIALWTGTACGSLAGVDCIVGSANTATLNEGSGLTPGQTYYIQISGNTGESGTFNLAVYAFQDCADCLNAATLTVTPLPINGTYQPGQTVNFCFHIDEWTQTNNNWFHGVQMAFGPGWNPATLTTTPPATPYVETSAFWGGTIASCGTWAYYPGTITSSANGSVWPAGFYFNGTYNQNPITGATTSCGSNADGNPGNNFGDGVANAGLVITPPANEWDFCWTITVAPGCNPGVSLSVKVTTSGDGESGAWTNAGCANDPATNFSAMVSCCPPTMATTPTCAGASAGSATATPVGSAGPYTYTWAPGGQNTAAITNVAAGTYTITVVDVNLCSATASATVASEALPVSTAGNDVSFCTGSNAAIGAAAVAGNTYLWAPTTGLSSATSANPMVTLTNNTANPVTTAYTVTTTTTATSCTSSATVNVTVNPLPTATASNTGPYCLASTIQLNTTGTGTYAWSGPGGFTSTVQNPAITGATLAMSGTYSVTVTNATNCSATGSTLVTISSSLQPVATNTGPYCTGAPAALSVAGGTTYTWSGPNTFSSNNQSPALGAASAAIAGVYNVTASDANGCSGTAATTVVVNQQPAATASNTGPYCVSATIQLNAGGGTTYSWSGPNAYTTTTQNPSVANATVAMTGAYNVTVTDANGCTATATTTVTVNTAPVANAGPAGNLTCTINQVTLNAVTAAGDLYNWSGPGIVSGATTATPVVNAAGTYTLTVTDGNGCTAAATTTVTAQPNTVTVTLQMTQVSCAGNDGTITATGSGGAAPYQYALNGGAYQAPNTFTGLNTGSYTVQAQDANGCTATGTISVTTTNPQQLTATAVSPVCAGQTGTITAVASGGVTPYQYAINGGAYQATGTFSGLAAGPYTIITEDVHTCSATFTITINPAPAPVVLAPAVTPVSCPGLSDGTITANASGGTPAYSYAWGNNAPNAATDNNLAQGNYTLTVTDANNCTASATAVITELHGITYTADVHNIFCLPLHDGFAEVTVDAASLPVTYQWSNGSRTASVYSLGMGTYGVTITNASGCTADTSLVVGNDSAFSVSVFPDDTTIQLGNSAAINLIAHGDNISFMYWDPSEYLDCDSCPSTSASPIQTILYRAFVTSDSGCVGYDSILVNVVPYYNIFIPNAFTPNGDGNNDYFTVYGEKDDWKQFSVDIFDRWGEKVFESKDMNFEWDGTYKGKKLDPQVLIYEIHLTFLNNHTAKLYKGSVTLIR